jgi:uncharacterized protein YecE (DUF72 family)
MTLSPLIRFGTSTWAYEGWQGQVYRREYAKTRFARECLGEYCQYLYNGAPLFRMVGNDSTFYRPPTVNQLRHYLTQIPEDFLMVSKVWEELTIPAFAKHARYGAKAGQPNPRFLDAAFFNELVLTPYREAAFQPHAGPFLFEFQRHGLPPGEFLERLDGFFGQVPKDFQYAVEIRNPGLLGEAYHRILERHGVAHVYNHWSFMPGLLEQHRRLQRFTAPFTVLRLLTPLKMTYEAAKKRASPYDRIVGELPDMRKETVELVRAAITENRPTFVLVNNRTEGNAPTTIQALVQMLQQPAPSDPAPEIDSFANCPWTEERPTKDGSYHFRGTCRGRTFDHVVTVFEENGQLYGYYDLYQAVALREWHGKWYWYSR